MFACCVHPVSVLNDAFYMACSLLMMFEDARENNMEEPYTRAGFTTTLYVTMSVSFCFPHTVAVSAFICVVLSVWVKPRQDQFTNQILGTGVSRPFVAVQLQCFNIIAHY